MNLPFSQQQFLEVFTEFNQAYIWVIGLLWLLSAVAFLKSLKPSKIDDLALPLVLIIQWLWSGIAYHFLYFSQINPAAYLFGGVFILQAVLLIWRGLSKPLSARFVTHSNWTWIGYAVIFYALFYPFIGILSGDYPHAPIFGVPCPTTIITLGYLMLLPKRESIVLGLIPMAWVIVGGSAAFFMNVLQDFGLIVAGGLLVLYWLFAKKAE